VLTTSGTTTSVYGFAGEQTDATGLVYLRARYYAAGQGRFTTKDIFRGDIFRGQTLQRFGYVLNNPIRFRDPTGHDDPITWPVPLLQPMSYVCYQALSVCLTQAAAVGYIVVEFAPVVGLGAGAAAWTITVMVTLDALTSDGDVDGAIYNRLNQSMRFDNGNLPQRAPVPQDLPLPQVTPAPWGYPPMLCPPSLDTCKSPENLWKRQPQPKPQPRPAPGPIIPPDCPPESGNKFFFNDVGPYPAPGRDTDDIVAELQFYFNIPGMAGEAAQLRNAQSQFDKSNGQEYLENWLMGRKFEAERAIFFASRNALVQAHSTGEGYDLIPTNFGPIQYIQEKWSRGTMSLSTAGRVSNEARSHPSGTYLVESNSIGLGARLLLQRNGGQELPYPYP